MEWDVRIPAMGPALNNNLYDRMLTRMKMCGSCKMSHNVRQRMLAMHSSSTSSGSNSSALPMWLRYWAVSQVELIFHPWWSFENLDFSNWASILKNIGKQKAFLVGCIVEVLDTWLLFVWIFSTDQLKSIWTNLRLLESSPVQSPEECCLFYYKDISIAATTTAAAQPHSKKHYNSKKGHDQNKSLVWNEHHLLQL